MMISPSTAHRVELSNVTRPNLSGMLNPPSESHQLQSQFPNLPKTDFLATAQTLDPGFQALVLGRLQHDFRRRRDAPRLLQLDLEVPKKA